MQLFFLEILMNGSHFIHQVKAQKPFNQQQKTIS